MEDSIISEITNSDIIAISSVVVALVALVVVILQGHVSRKHNMLTLRPVLIIESESSLKHGVSIRFRNHGQGPAFIKKLEYIIDGKSYNLYSGNDYSDLMKRVGLVHFDFSIKCNASVSDSVIPSLGEGIFIQFYNYDGSKIEDENTNRTIIESLPEFKVKYKCSYDKSYVETWKMSNVENRV
ncbi:hypothetical protein GL177_20575 [Vibrio toranzoniae]|uniref:hypothetical protein n=1 Tax=Vibrio toranzoniae TaxID=1194427 RepID=UPI00137757EC|nr:hypothetical protein [Vibrio toranzoniae]NAZ55683.1 hypothetical protein [Vibrio toranzoniae]